MTMVVQCPDDLVPARHPVRLVMALVETLDLSRFTEPIKAQDGVAGRDATAPQLLVGLWLYACIRGIGPARELARRCGAHWRTTRCPSERRCCNKEAASTKAMSRWRRLAWETRPTRPAPDRLIGIRSPAAPES